MKFSPDEKEKYSILDVLEPVWTGTNATEAQKALSAAALGRAQKSTSRVFDDKRRRMAEIHSGPEKYIGGKLLGMMGHHGILDTIKQVAGVANDLQFDFSERDKEDAFRDARQAASELKDDLLSFGIGSDTSDIVVDRFMTLAGNRIARM